MLRTSVTFFLLLALTLSAFCQSENQPKPKLIVGIVVDQMRYDYLERFSHLYGEGGLKRLMNEGANFHNHHFSYAPTYTGPGHASIFAGTTPAVHGIIGNDWYDRELQREIYITDDSTQTGVGTDGSAGKMGPHKLLSTTLLNELENFTAGESKTIAISMKDRGAIMPAGGNADAAYWFVGGDEGNWISSSHYLEQLPDWVNEFNNQKRKDKLLNGEWNLLFEKERYKSYRADNNPYEYNFREMIRPAFPYELSNLRESNGNYDLLKATPTGNTYTTDFAISTLKNENMGTDDITDFLAVSYSATDYLGHQFGPYSLEIQDTYARLDRDIAKLLKKLDQGVGEGNYTVFLTADHGAVPNPAFLKDEGLPADYLPYHDLINEIENNLSETHGEGKWVEHFINDQIYLNRKLISEKELNLAEVSQQVADIAIEFKGVSNVITSHQLHTASQDGIMKIIKNGHQQKRSGDVTLVVAPGWLTSYSFQGTTHGAPYSYDTHVPLIFFGQGIESADYYEQTYIKDIAPTISAILRMSQPSGCTGNPINALFTR